MKNAMVVLALVIFLSTGMFGQVVMPGEAIDITSNSARLTGSVVLGPAAQLWVRFEYGQAGHIDKATQWSLVVSGTPLSVSQTVSDLQPDGAYSYRMVASGQGMVAQAPGPKSFRTLPAGAPIVRGVAFRNISTAVVPEISAGSLTQVTGENFSADSCVTVDGNPAPTYSISDREIWFQIPWGIWPESSTIQVVNGGVPGAKVAVKILPFAPTMIRVTDANWEDLATGPGFHPLALSATGSDDFTLVVTGLGEVTTLQNPGNRAAVGIETRTRPTVTVNGVPADVLFSGLMPEEVGLYQVNVRVRGLRSGTILGTIGIEGKTADFFFMAYQP